MFAASAQVDYAYVAAAARQALSEQGEPRIWRCAPAARCAISWSMNSRTPRSSSSSCCERSPPAGSAATDAPCSWSGDPMQSIYQFREAEVGLFLRARDHGVGDIRLEALQLRRNFRSRAPLIAWINAAVRATVSAPRTTRAWRPIRYLPSVPARSETRRRRSGGDAASLAWPVIWHGEAAARACRSCARRARRDRAASIAVLRGAAATHARRSWRSCARPASPCAGVDLEPLRERPVIRICAALTRVLLHGADRTAWLALLRAPWCGLTLAELEALLGGAARAICSRLRLQAQCRKIRQ